MLSMLLFFAPGSTYRVAMAKLDPFITENSAGLLLSASLLSTSLQKMASKTCCCS